MTTEIRKARTGDLVQGSRLFAARDVNCYALCPEAVGFSLVMLGLFLVIRSLISMASDALQHFSDAGFPFFLLVPGIGTAPDGRWLRLRHVRSPMCQADFYRIVL